MRHTRQILWVLFLFTARLCAGQGMPGYNTSNYAGVSGIELNPSSIADMRYKVDVNLIGFGVGFSNNYIAMNSSSITDGSLVNYLKGNNPNVDFKHTFLYENTSSDDKTVSAFANLQLPSIAISLSKNISIGFTITEKTQFNIDQLSPELAHLAYTGLDANDAKNINYFNQTLKDDKFNLNEMSWMEYGFTYAQVISGKGPHFFKVGGTIKLVEGIQAAYIYAQNLSYHWSDPHTLSLFNSNFSYGQTANVTQFFGGQSFNIFHFLSTVSSSSAAFDVGATYEWRPNYADYKYDMDGQTGLERRNKNKYKLKIGVSLTDLGTIRFTKGNSALNFIADTANWNVKKLNFGSNAVSGLNSIIQNTFKDHSIGSSTFDFSLPTAFSVQIDYDLYKDFYLNLTTYTSPRFIEIQSKVHSASYYALTPRWDSKWFGAFLPLSVDGDGNFNVGAALRLGPIVIGTSNGLSVLVNKETYGADIHVAIKIPIFQGKPPRDRDNDGVSDKYDKCPDKKGSWDHHGCPDTDGDGVYDDVDQCPTVPGPVENHGCPWPDTDGDGVIDKLDSCPTVKGPKENHGCPWGDADKDGVPDNLDSCKNVPGPVENHGCPWGDADNDGIPDNLDSCPHVAGPAANHGCPWGDADNDGVPDNLDSCPHTPGPASVVLGATGLALP